MSDGWVAGVFFAVVFSMLGLCLYLGYKEAGQWEEFSKANGCVVSSKMDATVGFGPTSNGQVTTVFVPGKIAYTCNDGITYWRSE